MELITPAGLFTLRLDLGIIVGGGKTPLDVIVGCFAVAFFFFPSLL